MSIKDLVGKKMTKPIKFMGAEIKISKLSVEQVLEIQELAKANSETESDNLGILKLVIKSAVEDASTLSDEDFDTFPMDELSSLSTAILSYSGLNNGEKGK